MAGKKIATLPVSYGITSLGSRYSLGDVTFFSLYGRHRYGERSQVRDRFVGVGGGGAFFFFFDY